MDPRRIAGGNCLSNPSTLNLELMSWKPFMLRIPPRDRAEISGTMIEAGSETTSQVLNNTIAGLLSNPEAIRKCQEELDRVVGDDRTPTFDDEPNLPWIRSLGKVNPPPPLLP